MYIPIQAAAHPSGNTGPPCPGSLGGERDPLAAPVPHNYPTSTDATPVLISVAGRFGAFIRRVVGFPGDEAHPELRKRQFNGDEQHDQKVTIGIVVGVCIGVFIIGVVAFLYFYGRSIRLSEKRRRRTRKSSGSYRSSRGSNSSRSSDAPPPPPPPGPPPGPPE